MVADRCVLSAIDHDLAVLSSPTASDQEQLEALKFLGHWVGDVHQPLHVSFEDDRGGNGVKVTGGLCGGKLHGVWDSCIIERGLGTDAAAIAGQLRAAITDQQRSEWLASSPIDWANKSFAIATGPAVSYCVRTGAGCWYDTDRERLEPGSRSRCRPAIPTSIAGHCSPAVLKPPGGQRAPTEPVPAIPKPRPIALPALPSPTSRHRPHHNPHE